MDESSTTPFYYHHTAECDADVPSFLPSVFPRVNFHHSLCGRARRSTLACLDKQSMCLGATLKIKSAEYCYSRWGKSGKDLEPLRKSEAKSQKITYLSKAGEQRY